MGVAGYYSSAGFTSLSSIFNPSSATAYCGGWIQCGAFYHVCGSCNDGTPCGGSNPCYDPSTDTYYPCPCGDVCYAIPMEHYMCTGASQATCGVSCHGGMCDTGYMSCSWSMGPTPTPLPGSGPPPAAGVNCGHLFTRGQFHGSWPSPNKSVAASNSQFSLSTSAVIMSW
jgi:hypothetical protein